jgi:hypothetical protein
MHEIDLWETLYKNYYHEKLNLERYWIHEGFTLEHCLFIKKDKLAHGTIILNVFDFLLHHVACGEIAKDECDNFCATFEKHLHVGNEL